MGGKTNCRYAREIILARDLLRQPNARYRSCRGLGGQGPWIILEYDLATSIVIQLLIQPRTCKMSSSIFSAMSQIKFASTTRASLPEILST